MPSSGRTSGKRAHFPPLSCVRCLRTSSCDFVSTRTHSLLATFHFLFLFLLLLLLSYFPQLPINFIFIATVLFYRKFHCIQQLRRSCGTVRFQFVLFNFTVCLFGLELNGILNVPQQCFRP